MARRQAGPSLLERGSALPVLLIAGAGLAALATAARAALLAALIGLILASGANDEEMYVFGLSLAGFAVVFVFGLIRRHFDKADARRLEGHHV